MFRAPQILSLPVRSLLPSAFSEHSAAVVWQASKHVKEKKYKEFPGRDGSHQGEEAEPCTPKLSLFDLDCEDPYLGEASFQHPVSTALLSSPYLTPPFSTSAKAKSVSDPWKSAVDKDTAEDVHTVRTRHNCSTNTTGLQSWKRPRDYLHSSPGFPCKARCNLPRSHLCCTQHAATLSTQTSHTTNPFAQRTESHAGPFGQQVRALRQASPRAVDDWRDFLSVENESRCRQILGSNLQLYDGTRGGAQSRGENQRRWASVLVSLCSVQGQPAFLFTLRSTSLGRNKGDVSFAGGKSDPSDPDVVATALRETWEELGVNVAADRVWGILKPLRDMRGMMVAPVLANLGPLEELSFKPNPGEVEEIFTLPLSHLCDPRNCGYTHFRTGDKYGYTLPVFHNGKHRVWGLTAVALDRTLKLIVPSAAVDVQFR